jgi:hypothetical protein
MSGERQEKTEINAYSPVWDYVYNYIMNISGMTNYDYCKIIATWFYSVEERFNCNIQKDKMSQYPDFEKRIEQLEIRNGCNAISDISGVVEKFTGTARYKCEDVAFYRCFCNFVDQSAMFVLNLFFQYEKGFLPFPGTVSDQPAKIMELFAVLTYLKAERQKELEEKAQKKQQQRQKRMGR